MSDKTCAAPGRVPICIAETTRARLQALLHTPEFQGVGYTEFIERAIEAFTPVRTT